MATTKKYVSKKALLTAVGATVVASGLIAIARKGDAIKNKPMFFMGMGIAVLLTVGFTALASMPFTKSFPDTKK